MQGKNGSGAKKELDMAEVSVTNLSSIAKTLVVIFRSFDDKN